MFSLAILLGLLAVAVVSVASLALTTPAEARPGRHLQHRHHVVRTIPAAPVEAPTFWSRLVAPTSTSARVSTARRCIGATARQLGLPNRLWCADFMNLIERRSGRSGTGSRLAKSFSGYGRRIQGPVVGAIAVMSRRGGGHVGVVSGVTPDGDPIVISGNHGRRVAESVYPRSRILAYVAPE